MASGKKGWGGVMAYDSGGAVFVTIANITRIRPFGMKADVIDITTMTSTSEFREKLAGLKDAGQATLELNWDDKDTGHLWLITNLGIATPFKITGPGASPKVITFTGFVQSIPPEIPMDKQMTCAVVFEITGVVTLT